MTLTPNSPHSPGPQHSGGPGRAPRMAVLIGVAAVLAAMGMLFEPATAITTAVGIAAALDQLMRGNTRDD